MRRFSVCVLLFLSSSWALAAPLAAKKLVLVGDSLSEGYGVSREQAYPALLQKKFDQEGQHWVVINSSISGSTSASAASRVAWALKQRPDLLVLELGANDGLRGLSVADMELHLGQAIALAQKSRVPLLLVGMRLPPNYGAAYTQDFADAFGRLAKKFKVPFLPFLLVNVAGVRSLNQGDGIHPNEKGHVLVTETVYQALVKLL